MKTGRIAVLALLLGTADASACSLAPFSKEFEIDRQASRSDRPLEGLTIESVNFVPWLVGGDSCDGVGWLEVRLGSTRPRIKGLRQHGYLVRAVSGVNDTGFFPDYPLRFIPRERGKNTLFWGWTGITPDADGHVRWNLEIVPVSRSGVQGEGVRFCVSSDRSCP